MNSDIPALPAPFSWLEEFLPSWDLPDFQARLERRATIGMPEIVRFYEAIAPHARDMQAHLDAFPLGELPLPEARLMRLFLALAHVSMAVEQHGQPLPASCVYPNTIRLGEGLAPA